MKSKFMDVLPKRKKTVIFKVKRQRFEALSQRNVKFFLEKLMAHFVDHISNCIGK